MRLGAPARIASAFGVAILLCSAAGATQPSLRDVERRRARAETSRKQIESDAHKAARNVEDLRESLVVAAAQQRVAEEEVVRLEASVRELSGREWDVNARKAEAQGRMERALIALYQIEASGAPGPGRAVAAVIGRDSSAQLGLLALDSASVAQERRDLAQRRLDLESARRDLEKRRVLLAGLLAQEQQREDKLNRGLVAALSQERSLAEQAQTLRDLVRRSARAGAATRRASLSIKPGASTPGASAQLAPRSSTILHRFGQRIGSGATAHLSQGLTLRVRPGAQIQAPANATIGYAGRFRSYGLVLILNLEGDYAVVLTGVDSVLARTGQEVLAGQPIAEMAPEQKLGVTQSPELYVEVRKAGVPVDPSGLFTGRLGRIVP